MSDYECPHCPHDKIAGREIPAGSKMCCMCHQLIQQMPLTWEGDGA